MTTTTDRRLRAGFRVRVLGSFVVLMAGAVALGFVVQRAVVLRDLGERVDRSLDQERAELEALAGGHDPRTGEPFAGDVGAIFDTFLQRNLPQQGEVYLTFVDGAPYRTTPAPLRLDTDPELTDRWGTTAVGERGELATDAGPVRYIAVPLRAGGETRGVFVVANFTGAERDRIESGLRTEAVVYGLVLVIATVIAWFVAGRLLRPVRQLTETARSISESDLTRRIPVDGDDEVARLARTFNEMLDRLERAFVAQRTFVDDAGHELRTPITIIRGHLDLMGDDPDERRETMAVVSEELDRMARIVDDLLVLARSERPDFLRTEPVELADLTTELLAKARALGDRDWQLDACAEGTVDADPQRLAQAVLNLARNAVEHTPPGGVVALGSSWEADGVRLWVRDTGTGIPPEEHQRIFDRFARGRTGRRRSDGAGLGLAIVRSVAVAHGGRVELRSAPGTGSTFTIVLPAVLPAGEPTDLGAPEAGGTDDTVPMELVGDADDTAPTRVVGDTDDTKRIPTWPGS